MRKEISNRLYKVTMLDDDSQWIAIDSVETRQELVFVHTTGTIKVRGKVVEAKRVCKECGRELP